MKRKIYLIITLAAMLAGCNTELIVSEATGSLSFDLDCKTDYTDVVTKATDDDLINKLSIDVERINDGWKKTYAPYSTIRGTVIELGAGLYTLTASSPEKKEAAFDQPIFLGGTEFEIKTGAITDLETVTCTIQNTMVTVILSENVVNELVAYTVTITNGKGSLSWNKTSEVDDFEPAEYEGKTVYVGKKAGYFSPSPLTITINGVRSDGYEAKTTRIINNVNIAENHQICFDVNVNGSVDFGEDFITISNEVNPIVKDVIIAGPVQGGDDSGDDDGDDEGGDEGGGDDNPDVGGPDAPYLVWDANPDFTQMNIDDNLNADLVIHAPGKIKDFLVIVDSEVLSPTIAALSKYADEYTGGTVTMDMIGDDVLIENLAGMDLGLPLGDEISGQTEVPFSLSGLLPLINLYDPEPGAQHKFTLKVTDEEGAAFEKLLIFVSI